MWKVVLMAVGIVWVLIGFLLGLSFWTHRHEKAEADAMYKYPVLIVLICLIFGPIIFVWAMLKLCKKQ